MLHDSIKLSTEDLIGSDLRRGPRERAMTAARSPMTRCEKCGEPYASLLTEKQIAGALKAAIDAHGPITATTRHHAAKRIYAELKAARRAEHEARCVVVATCEG